ncbi:ion channel [Mycoplasma sp. 3686d]|uniref:ion channel n=1 Tax=Mycoplasma sp. 3686d TaxID=2967300 RepID=UPI00211BF81D|nr:ion channel [Mycoplasma sp. 3686d]UUM24708.1 ion channel [Mycoplasma sp. 3686d]
MFLKLFSFFNIIFKFLKEQQKMLWIISALAINIILLFALGILSAEKIHYNAELNNQIQKYANDHKISFFEASIKISSDPSKLPKIESNTVSNFFDALYYTFFTLVSFGYKSFSPKSDVAKILVGALLIISILIIAIVSAVIGKSIEKHLKNKDNINLNKEDNESKTN